MRADRWNRGFLTLVMALGLTWLMAPEAGAVVDVKKDGAFVPGGVGVATIAAALQLVPGTLDGNYELVVHAGQYNEVMQGQGNNLIAGIVINRQTGNAESALNFNLTIRAAGDGPAVLGGPGAPVVTRRMVIQHPAENVTIQGLQFGRFTDEAIFCGLSSGGVPLLGPLTLRDNVISNPNGSGTPPLRGIAVAGGRLVERLSITGNRISGVGQGIRMGSGMGETGNYIQVRNNLIFSTSEAGIQLWANGTGDLVLHHIEIANNTFYNTGASGIRLQEGGRPNQRGMPRYVRLKNNIVWAVGNSATCVRLDTLNAVNPPPYLEASNYNDLYATGGALIGVWGTTTATTLGGWQSVSGKDANSISANPQFEDAANGDFNELCTSPCIDAGDPADPVGAEPGNNGGRINQGAYGGTSQATQDCA